MQLFVYGTLMFPEVWLRIAVGRRHDAQPALLSGFERYRVKGGDFPVIVPGGDRSRVSGIVYYDVADSIARLDNFESELYVREEVEVVLDSGAPLCCQTYVLPRVRRNFASTEAWDPDWFQREALADYLQRMSAWGY
jgi:gamma-glutamylcyclotransferase (GGCT)/AIG2-like uncharacterized protein YtfP